MYQVLYRKWRPKTFDDVVGQSHITETLKNEIKASRIAHAYLFTGSRGTGKTTCAKILAKAINCLDSSDGNPCGNCINCRGIEDGTIMDIVEIDAASNNGVDNIRELKEESSFTPSVAKYRVYIIDEVHMLSIGAFNALLKTLEEPPSHVVFILATTEVHKLPATILSRCQRFDFHKIDPHDICDRLRYVALKEGKTLEEDAGLLIAGLSDGALRDALSLLDQCIGKSDVITSDLVVETAGLIGNKHIFDISDFIIKKDISSLLKLIDELNRSSKDMSLLAGELISHFRNIMLIKVIDNPRDMIVVTESEYCHLQEQAEKFSLSAVISVIQSLEDCTLRISKSSNSKIELELSLVKICSPSLASSDASLISRVEAIESIIDSNNFNVVRNSSKKKPKEESSVKETIKPVESSVDKEKCITQKESSISEKSNAQLWNEILDGVNKSSPSLFRMLVKSKAEFCENCIYIDAKDIVFKMLDIPEKRKAFNDVILSTTGKVYAIKKLDQSNEKSSVDTPINSNIDDFLNSINDNDVNIKICD